MRQTPLIDAHRKAQAKLVDFAGWEMPIHYTGVVDEYQTVRRQAGLFDVSHMGRISVTGPGSLAFLQRVTTNDVSKLSVHQSQYSMVCTPQGGIKDDIFIYHVKPYEFLVCVNASNREKIVAWLQENVAQAKGCKVQDHSSTLAQLAIQGPASRDILTAAGLSELATLKIRHCLDATLCGQSTLVTRTGYTGELGYELYVPAEGAAEIWNRLLESGRPHGIKPTGLGARDLLRLEMAYLLYGNDMNEGTTPIEAGAEWVMKFDKGEFIGRTALFAQQSRGATRRLVAFELVEKAVPRHGFKILSHLAPHAVIGEVTSGNLSPLLQKGIGMGYVPPAAAQPGSSILIDIRGKSCPALVVKPPFYKKAAAS
ncbi:MAG: Aminomethyltransferase (glycine cleavage system T protein) [Nitrospira sp.]|jgi:aminomethyltransferase|nr:MAG: Aminomethyltransferase (glycine cleavage system T protein) [Nitrospira sp.]